MSVLPRGRRLAAGIAAAALIAFAAVWLGLELRWFRGPFPPLGKSLAWQMGQPEAAYNFAVVEPGRVYRSGRPDTRFLELLMADRGLERVVSLTGESGVHVRAREMGLDVHVYDWSTRRLPPEAELRAVLDMLVAPEPVLVHCAGGSDRTGYAVAFHRALRDGWPLEQAVDEMRDYWHSPERDPELHREIRALLDTWQAAPTPASAPRARSGGAD